MIHDKINGKIYISTYTGEILVVDENNFEKLETIQTSSTKKLSKLLLLKNGIMYAIGDSNFSIIHEDQEIFNFKPFGDSWTRSLVTFDDEKKILVGGREGGLKIFSTDDILGQNTEPISTVAQSNDWIYSISNIRDEFYGYNVANNSDYVIKRFKDHKEVKKFTKKAFSTSLCSLVVNEKFLMVGTYEGKIHIIDVDLWEIVQCVDLNVPVSSMVLLPNGMLATSHYRGVIHLVDLKTFEVVEKISGITSKDFDDVLVVGNHLVFCDDAGFIHVFSIPVKILNLLNLFKKTQSMDIKFLFV
jgi:hypothetical protein